MKDFDVISDEIVSLVSEWEPRLISLDREIISRPRNNQHRNIRQIIGHLADSASNNTHRVVHLQYQPSPLVFPNYATSGNNDRWIAIQNYEEEDWTVLVCLWKYSLLHFSHVIKNVREEKLDNEWIAGPGQKITLKEMILDFVPHLKLHLSEINELIGKSSTESLKPPVTFDSTLIAPCGINCGTCYAYLRTRDRCNGCLVPAPNKPKTRLHCNIRNCEKHGPSGPNYCCDCSSFPCERMKRIDQRYRVRYRSSLIQNLLSLKETGITDYLKKEGSRWTCPDCGSVLSVHREKCIVCGYVRNI